MADSFFKEEDTKAAVDSLNAWLQKFPEAGKELKDLWKKHYVTAGHKTMARLLVKAEKKDGAK